MLSSETRRSHDRLKNALINYWKVVDATASGDNLQLKRILEELSSLTPSSGIDTHTPNSLTPFFIEVLEGINSPKKSLERLNKTLIQTSPYIHWYPNANIFKDAAEEPVSYLADIISLPGHPDTGTGIFSSGRMSMGLMLLAPGQYYSGLKSSLTETWLILSGSSWWRGEEDDWSKRKPGDYFTFDPSNSHAVETRREPLFALRVGIED